MFRIHRIRLFLGLPDPHPGSVRHKYASGCGSGSRSFSFLIKVLSGLKYGWKFWSASVRGKDPRIRIASGSVPNCHRSGTLLYSTLPHLPPLGFHNVGECWDWTQDCCDFFGYNHSTRSHPRYRNLLSAKKIIYNRKWHIDWKTAIIPRVRWFFVTALTIRILIANSGMR